MPNVWAHVLFGKEVLKGISEDALLGRREWKNAFQLGCQGPDFLFYHRYLPWQASTPLNRLGTLMHNVRCGPFLLALFEEARKRPLTDPANAYVLGFLLHHVLDRHVHPFVFSLSGFKKWHHQRFETALDSAILFRRAGIHTGRTPFAPEMDTGGKLPGAFAADFLRIATVHYPALGKLITAAQLDEAVAGMHQAQKLFFDPSGWKGKLLAGQIEPFSPPRRQPSWDVLNEARRPWIDPCDRTVFHTESAFDLWDRALADGLEMTKASLAWLQAGDAEETAESRAIFAGLLGDVSYETGLPCGSAWITFAESIVPE